MIGITDFTRSLCQYVYLVLHMPDTDALFNAMNADMALHAPTEVSATTGLRACAKTEYRGIIPYESRRDDSLDR